jgi:hypothetical protein
LNSLVKKCKKIARKNLRLNSINISERIPCHLNERPKRIVKGIKIRWLTYAPMFESILLNFDKVNALLSHRTGCEELALSDNELDDIKFLLHVYTELNKIYLIAEKEFLKLHQVYGLIDASAEIIKVFATHFDSYF